MVISMVCFAIEDALIKSVTQSIPAGQILTVFGLGGTFVFALGASLSGQNLFTKEAFSRPMRTRILFEVIGRLFYVLALAYTTLSSTTVILQAAPIFVVLGAALFFHEKVGWRRWIAIFIGLLGVVVIVRPGSESFSILSLFAVLGMLGFAGRDLASRAAPSSLGVSVLGFYGFVSIVLAGLVISAWQRVPFVFPDPTTALYLLGTVLFGVIAYSGLMKAMRTGEVSAVTPFRYTRVLFGVSLGVLFFAEPLTSPVVAGCCLIVISGLVIPWSDKSQRSPA
ncbi:MAG: DMT family transporter [Candidatus Thiodiazotropha sp. (ex. Lucinisca nassula)]|nr:DMT family transporter [Candidatus Thiodiazotropha sp. (ex. Lucinisca nassula)]